MANYYNQTVVTPSIPLELITPLEAWILKNLFEFHEDEGDHNINFLLKNA